MTVATIETDFKRVWGHEYDPLIEDNYALPTIYKALERGSMFIEPALHYCPYCGDVNVWAHEGNTDLYEDTLHFCGSCWATFHLN